MPGFLEKIRGMLLDPVKTLTSLKAEKGVGEAFKYYAVIALVRLVVDVIAVTFNIQALGAAAFGYEGAIGFYVGILIGIFIWSGIFHLFAKLLAGRGGFGNTFRAIVYASTPGVLFGWIPYIGLLFWLYSLYLYVKGFSLYHEVSMARAFGMVFIPIAIIVFILFVFFLVLGIAYLSLLGGVPY